MNLFENDKDTDKLTSLLNTIDDKFSKLMNYIKSGDINNLK